jgi:hypothetical protein
MSESAKFIALGEAIVEGMLLGLLAYGRQEQNGENYD